jgi:outer membrane beta-barrel protein
MLKLTLLALATALMFTNKTHAGEKSLYDFLWLDPDKKVYVLQNKLYKKERSVYADLGYLANFTSKFQDTQGFGIRTGYYLTEEWAVEGFYNSYSNANNDEYRNVRIYDTEPFIRRLNSTYGLLAIWSPFYGKINTFNQIFYFDWSFGLGVGKINAASNRMNAGVSTAETRFDAESYTGAAFKTKVKFHLREHVHLGVEYFNTYYNAPGPRNPNTGQDPKDKLRINTDVVLSIGFSY